MPRIFALTIFVLATGLQAQGPSKDPRPGEDVRDRLKRAVDRSLAKFVRDLRTELHRAIDEAAADGALDALIRDLDGRSPGGVDRPSPRISEGRPRKVVLKGPEHGRADRLLRAFDRLVMTAGPADPRVKQMETDLRAALGAEVFSLKRVPWFAFGLEVEPVDQPTRDRLGKQLGTPVASNPMAGLKITAVRSGSAAAKAGLEIGDLIPMSGLGSEDAASITRLLAASEKTISIIVQKEPPGVVQMRLPVPAGLAKRVLPSPSGDSKALMDEMLRKAIRDLVPRGGLVVPDRPAGQTRPNSPAGGK